MTGKTVCIKTEDHERFRAVLAAGDVPCVHVGEFTASGSATVTAYGSATVRASGSATVRASGSATVTAYGSATVTASGSATVTAYDSATVRASGSATVRAYGSATVTASGYVAVQKLSQYVTVSGGVVIETPDLSNPACWADYYGLDIANGVVTVYKGVGADLRSSYGVSYAPLTEPEAPDFAPTRTCGAGLHFSPRPFMTRTYVDAVRFVACAVALADLIPLDDKCKAPRCTVLYECDEDGEPVQADVAAGVS